MQKRGRLTCWGDADILERARPVLDSFSESIVLVGKVGAGHRMKLLHDDASLGSMAQLCEVAAHARQAGCGMKTVIDMLRRGGAGGVALERLAPSLLGRDPSNVPFCLNNALKDISSFLEMAKDGEYHRDVANGVEPLLAWAVQAWPRVLSGTRFGAGAE